MNDAHRNDVPMSEDFVQRMRTIHAVDQLTAVLLKLVPVAKQQREQEERIERHLARCARNRDQRRKEQAG